MATPNYDKLHEMKEGIEELLQFRSEYDKYIHLAVPDTDIFNQQIDIIRKEFGPEIKVHEEQIRCGWMSMRIKITISRTQFNHKVILIFP